MAKMLRERQDKIDVSGEFSPFYEFDPVDQPVLAVMPGEDKPFAIVFSTVEKLRESMEYMGIDDYKIKKIDDGFEFSASIFEAGLRIMRDPYIVDGEKTRWTELMQP